MLLRSHAKSDKRSFVNSLTFQFFEIFAPAKTNWSLLQNDIGVIGRSFVFDFRRLFVRQVCQMDFFRKVRNCSDAYILSIRKFQ